MSPNHTLRRIESRKLTGWNEMVGNTELKNHLRNMARRSAHPNHDKPINTLVLGPSRSGKTAAIELFIRTAFCWALDANTLQPCGECLPCRDLGSLCCSTEYDKQLWNQPNGDLGLLAFDGNTCTKADIEAAIASLSDRDETWRWIFCIDQVHGLIRRNLDHSLLKMTEQYAHVTWIVSTAFTQGLDPMFRNRFTEVVTERPTVDELALFLTKRCRLPEIDIELDHQDTPVLLAERSNRVVGRALQCLALAKMQGGKLTRKLVEQYRFEQVELG